MSDVESYFLPYQARWLADTSRFKLWEKSRRIGATYVQAYEDTLDAAKAEAPLDVWFSSADLTAAREYIGYVGQWARVLDLAARDLGEVVLDAERDVKAFVVEFTTGRRIHALSSNPTAFRSKGGKLVLDEYAFHRDPEAMWKAALPIITWGFPCRILSTYNGKGNRFYRLVAEAKEAAREGRAARWSVHSTTIRQAVAEGLADKIKGRKLTAKERRAWVEALREAVGDDETWMQEYMCEPVDEATAWLTWDLITAAEHTQAGRPELYAGGDCFVGQDIGRRRDLTVIWVIELMGDVRWTREVVRMKRASFATQDLELDRVFETYNVRRACIDQTGMGEKPVEDAKRRYGQYRVEGVLFTGPVKQHLATICKQVFEDRRARIPEDREIRASHHSVRKVTTVAGNPRFDAERTEAGHADEFWAHALALHAGEAAGRPRWRPVFSSEGGLLGAASGELGPPAGDPWIPA